MPKNKQQKKKDRERRVAQKKHTAALKRAENKADKDTENAFGKPKKVFTVDPLPKTQSLPVTSKLPFTHRRTGG